MTKLFHFRDRLSGHAQEMSAEQDGKNAIVRAEMRRSAAQGITVPEYAKRTK